MAKLSKDEWISLFNNFINESDSYGEAIGKVQKYIVDNYSFSIEKILIFRSNTLSFFFKIFIQYNALKFILHTQPIHPVNHILQPPVEHFSERL